MAYTLVVLLSGSGSNLQALIDARQAGALDAEIVLVASDRAEAYGLRRALDHGLAVACVPLPAAPREQRARVRAQWERRLLLVVRAFQPDLVVSSGFMRVLSAEFLDQCGAPVINQHPALLPEHGGNTVTTSSGYVVPALRGPHVVRDALRLGLPVTGCTIHRVTPLIDDGPVLARAEVSLLPEDDESTLHERIKTEERRLVVEVVQQLAHESGTAKRP